VLLEMNILTLSNHGNTFHPKEGADARKYHLITELSKYNRITVLESDRYAEDSDRVPESIDVVYYHEYFMFGRPLSFILDVNPDLMRKAYKTLKHSSFDAILISFPYGFLAMKLVSLLTNNRTPILYDAHNVEGNLIRHIGKDSNPYLVNAFLRVFVPILEYIAVKYIAKSVLVVSEDDRLLFEEYYNLNRDCLKVIPSGTSICGKNIAYDREQLRSFYGIKNDEIAVIFHGAYNYAPNFEAFHLITDYIAPGVNEIGKNIRFVVAGNGMPAMNRDNILSLGYVEDIVALLSAVDIAIVPIRVGGGTRLKVLDYLGAGLPIITTEKGIEGIEAENGKDAIILEDVDDTFVDAIIHLSQFDEERKRMGSNAQMLGERKYEWSCIGRELHRHLNGLIR
jgi:polysaccharide biosynthesis protein PslH